MVDGCFVSTMDGLSIVCIIMFNVWIDINLMITYPNIHIKWDIWNELTCKNLLLCIFCNAKLSKYLHMLPDANLISTLNKNYHKLPCLWFSLQMITKKNIAHLKVDKESTH